MRTVNIAIDGPAGAGKSTIAKKLSKDLGYIYVDTGAMYRALALFMLENDIDIDSEEAVREALDRVHIRIAHENGQQVVYLNERNVNGLIRTEQVSQMASKTSAIGAVREKLLSLQRDLAASENVVMDGRDIGTHVLPDAQVKIYLTASSAVRAKRRYNEHLEKGEPCDLDAIEKDIIERDHRDMNRAIAPLKQAEDAVYVDTSDMKIDEVMAERKAITAEKVGV